jgi:hypothetical protein
MWYGKEKIGILNAIVTGPSSPSALYILTHGDHASSSLLFSSTFSIVLLNA